MRRVSARRVALAVIGLMALGLLALAAAMLAYGAQDQARPADVIIVLGAGEIGTERRTAHGIALYHDGIAPWLLCSGGYRHADGDSEAELCASLAEDAGVPASAILLEPESRSTEQNAENAARIMRAEGLRSAVVVSDGYHLLRARWLFEREDVTVWTSPATPPGGAGDVFDSAYNITRELGALIYQGGKAALGR
ncbi:MAG: YdcF family protein [Chloroflexi bacterium]|nr:YdcF family protein [Chloroflexota bacterium]